MASANSTRNTLVLPQFQPIQLKLDRSNYAFWRVLVQSAIRAHGFDDFISPTAISPSPLLPSGSSGEMISNPEFVTWIRRDQYLFSWMLSSVSESMLGHAVRCRTSRELWAVFEDVFRSQSKAQTMRYRKQLQSTKKGNLSVEDYFMKMRGIADQLAAIGKPLDDDELLMNIMEGFGPEYESLVVNTMQRTDAPNLQEVQLAFQAYEVRLAQQQTALFEHAANVAYRGRGQPVGVGTGAVYGGGRGGMPGNIAGSQFGRGSKPNFGKVLMCQLCGRTGHVALKCFKRFDIHFTGVENQGSTAAAGQNLQGSTAPQKVYLADFCGNADVGTGSYVDGEGNWYVDSGATTHITNEFSNLAVGSDYSGGDSLVVGNGQVQPQDIVGGDSN